MTHRYEWISHPIFYWWRCSQWTQRTPVPDRKALPASKFWVLKNTWVEGSLRTLHCRVKSRCNLVSKLTQIIQFVQCQNWTSKLSLLPLVVKLTTTELAILTSTLVSRCTILPITGCQLCGLVKGQCHLWYWDIAMGVSSQAFEKVTHRQSSWGLQVSKEWWMAGKCISQEVGTGFPLW